MSTVPFIRENNKDPVEIAATLHGKKDDEWQRELDYDRAATIGTWWDDTDAQMLNPVVLKMRKNLNPFAVDSFPVECQVTGINKEMQPVVFDVWQVKKCPECNQHFNDIISNDQDYRNRIEEIFAEIGETYDPNIHVYSDQCMRKGCDEYSMQINHRPLQIADGQHRIRGTQHPNGDDHHHENIVFTLMPPNPGSAPISLGFTNEDSGKIFTDINVRASGLVPNHKLNMAWRFKIDNAKIWNDIVEYDFSSGSRAARSYVY